MPGARALIAAQPLHPLPQYDVIRWRLHKGKNGKNVFQFQLRRRPGQGELVSQVEQACWLWGWACWRGWEEFGPAAAVLHAERGVGRLQCDAPAPLRQQLTMCIDAFLCLVPACAARGVGSHQRSPQASAQESAGRGGPGHHA